MYNIYNFINFPSRYISLIPRNAYEELEKNGLDKINNEKIEKKLINYILVVVLN